MVKYLFNFVILPASKLRNHLDLGNKRLAEALKLFGSSKKEGIKLSQYFVENDGWKTDKFDAVVKAVSQMSFFRRFSVQ